MRLKVLISNIVLFLISISIIAQSFKEVSVISNSDMLAYDDFGYSVSISGNFAVIGRNENSTFGGVYIYEKDENGYWHEIQKLVPSIGYRYFGNAVSIWGDYIAVADISAPIEYNLDGCIYIFKKQEDNSWVEIQRIDNPNMPLYYGDRVGFGYNVSLYDNYLITGVPEENEDVNEENTLMRAGAAYIYERDTSGNWNEVQKIVASDRADYDEFGNCVSIFNNYAVIGVSSKDYEVEGRNPLYNAGAAYVFKRNSDGSWNEIQKLIASDIDDYSAFGFSVDMINDYFIIGAYNSEIVDSEGNTVSHVGSAYLFKKDESDNWIEIQKIMPSDGDSYDNFGCDVSISENYVLVGAPHKHYISGGDEISNVGAAYFFKKESDSSWVQIKKVLPGYMNSSMDFGYDVSLDGDYAIIGSSGSDLVTLTDTLQNAGVVYSYESCNPTFSEITVSECFSYSVNGETFYESGEFTQSLINSEGCDSILTLYLTIDTVDTRVEVIENRLTAFETSALYQWLDCYNYNAINNAQSQSYNPLEEGSYAVEITKNGCVDTSSCYTVALTDVSNLQSDKDILIYPNPVKNELIIKSDRLINKTSVVIYNVHGQAVLNKVFRQDEVRSVNVDELISGIYFIYITSDNESRKLKFIKE